MAERRTAERQHPAGRPGGRACRRLLAHLELQGRNESDLPRRVAEYYLGLHRLLDAHVEPIVLYVGKEPLRMPALFATPRMHFEFQLLDIREIDGEPLLASDDLGDNIMATLTQVDLERGSAALSSRQRGWRAGSGSINWLSLC